MVAPDLAAAVHPLQVVQTHMLEPSHPSQQSSPQQSPLHHPNHSPSHHNPHSTYFPFQAQLHLDDLQPQIAQAQLPHHSTQQNLPTLEGLDWSISQSYPYPSMDVAANWQPPPPPQQQPLTNTAHSRQIHHHPQQVHTTHRFPSTHRHSPNQQAMAGPSNLHHSTLASDLSQESTAPRMRAHVENQTGVYSDLGNTSMGPNHALNLDGSPSWSSAMTQMPMAEFDHFYRAPAEPLHGPLPPLNSSHPHLPSHSSIGLPPPANHYSQELSRQQLQQLRQQHLRLEQARRHSLEGEYLQHYNGTLHHPPSQPHNFLPHNEEVSRLHHYQMHHGAHDASQAGLPSPPLLDPSAYSHTRHLHPQVQRAHPHYLGEENHNGKYDPLSLRHTPPLHLE